MKEHGELEPSSEHSLSTSDEAGEANLNGVMVSAWGVTGIASRLVGVGANSLNIKLSGSSGGIDSRMSSVFQELSRYQMGGRNCTDG